MIIENEKEISQRNLIGEFYYTQAIDYSDAKDRLEKKNTSFILAEIASFVCLIGCLVAYTVVEMSAYWLLLPVALFMVYLVIRKRDAMNNQLMERYEDLSNVYRKELGYLANHFSDFDAGDRYIDAHHDFSFDLDIFGKNSLFHRINRTVTSGGSDNLARTLSNTQLPSIDEIACHREAIWELAEREPLRTEFLSYGQRAHIDTEAILKGLKNIQQVHIPRFTLHPLALVIAIGCLMVFYALLIGTIWGPLPYYAPMFWGFMQIMLAFAVCARPLKAIYRVVNVIYPRFKECLNMMILIVNSDLKSQELQGIINQLSNGRNDAIQSFHQLKAILHGIDQRNEVWIPISNAFFLGDYFLVRQFLQWQEKNMAHVDDWISALCHFDACVSMATFRYNEPLAIDAKFVEADEVVFQAKGIIHPFLGYEAVSNSFTIYDQNYYIVTGANMAGKSTFLRSIGINYILALCGMPVFAKSLTVSVFSLFSSMRTSDDLTHGISYFNAELLRLQQLLNACQQNRHTLIILDEILKGTNSLDKLNGSRLFLEAISQLPVTGIIATHDLELSKMADKYPDRFHNYCFEIKLYDEIIYTYKISKGVAQNQNATHLLMKMLKENRVVKDG